MFIFGTWYGKPFLWLLNVNLEIYILLWCSNMERIQLGVNRRELHLDLAFNEIIWRYWVAYSESVYIYIYQVKHVEGFDFINRISCINFCFRYASNPNSTGFCRSTRFMVADFSYNFLVGSIPKCLEYLPRFLLLSLSHSCFLLGKSSFTWYLSCRSSFQGNCLQNKDPEQRSTTQCGMYNEIFLLGYYLVVQV
jgi:hypothetical protein